MPPESPPSLKGDGGGGRGDRDQKTEAAAVAVVAAAAATQVSPLAEQLPRCGRRGRWPGPGCLRAPGAAASAPARGSQPPSLPGSPGLSSRGTRRQGPSASAAALGSNRPTTTDKLVFSLPRGRPSAEPRWVGWGPGWVNPRSLILRRVLGAQGARLAALLGGHRRPGPPEPGSSVGWARPRGESHGAPGP